MLGREPDSAAPARAAAAQQRRLARWPSGAIRSATKDEIWRRHGADWLKTIAAVDRRRAAADAAVVTGAWS